MAATKKRTRSKSKIPSGPGMPALLGLMTVLVLLVGGWILAGGNVGGWVRSASERWGGSRGAAGAEWSAKPTARPTKPPVYNTTSAPTPAPPVIVQDDQRVQALEAQLAEKDEAITAKDGEIERLKTELNALQTKYDNMQMQVQMLKAELKQKNSG